MAHASSWMNLPLALLIFLFLGSSSALPVIDYSEDGIVTPVKNQGRGCDNSWAFAAVSVVESALIKKGGWTAGGLDLSEQQVLDCGSYPMDRYAYGCYNATVDDALRFITTRGGLSREQDYPLYTGVNSGICQQQWGSNVSTQGLMAYLPLHGSLDELTEALTTYGPVAVAICRPAFVYFYRGDIYDKTCIPDCYHTISMTLVGYDTHYWILKNSWGTLWGEDGFMWLARADNRCGIATHPYN